MARMSLENVTWRKSSYSGSSGEGNCVEVGYLPVAIPAWRKSSHSGSNGEGDCVEVAFGGTVAVRDSKNPAGPILTVSEAAWRSFVSAPSRRARA
jgi:hypothetical protein